MLSFFGHPVLTLESNSALLGLLTSLACGRYQSMAIPRHSGAVPAVIKRVPRSSRMSQSLVASLLNGLTRAISCCKICCLTLRYMITGSSEFKLQSFTSSPSRDPRLALLVSLRVRVVEYFNTRALSKQTTCSHATSPFFHIPNFLPSGHQLNKII